MNGPFIILYLAAQVIIGIWISRRIKTESDYYLGGRNVSLFLVTFSLFATWFGAETCLGSSGQVYTLGLSGSRADPFGFSLCLFLLGLLLAARLRRGEYVTLADYFRRRYGPIVETIAVWIMIPSSLIWGAAQLRAFGQIISATTSLPVKTTIILSALFVICYTFLGGLLGDIYTDLLQGIIVVAGLAMLLIAVLGKIPDLGSALAGIDPSRLSFIGPGETILERLDRWMVPILGSLVTQETVARVLAAKSASVARKASYIACVMYLIVGSIPVFIGLLGPALLPGIADKEQFLIQLSQAILPRFLFIVFAGALISAILSTVDSILLAVSALLTHNLLIPFFAIRDEKARVILARLTVAGSGALASFIAIVGGGIYNLVLTASAFGTAGVLVITLAGFFTRAAGSLPAVSALVAGLVLNPLGQYVFHFEAPFLTAVLGAAMIFLAAEILQKKSEPTVPAAGMSSPGGR